MCVCRCVCVHTDFIANKYANIHTSVHNIQYSNVNCMIQS